MSIDYYSCKYCGETILDCGDYIRCTCGEVWCDMECAKEDGFRIDKEEFFDEDENVGYEEETSCKYCREEDFDDLVLLNFILEDYNITREELIENYKNKDKKKCKDCDSCSFGFFKSKPEKFVCIGVKNPFVIDDVNNYCTEY